MLENEEIFIRERRLDERRPEQTVTPASYAPGMTKAQAHDESAAEKSQPQTPWAAEIAKQQAAIAALSPTPEPEKKSHGLLAGRLGKWAFAHKDAMSNDPLPWYGIRNAMASALGITVLVTIHVPMKFGFSKIKRATAALETAEGAARKDGRNFLVKAIHKVAGNSLFENSFITGVSFAGFRTGYKLWQRNYDRLFVKPGSEEEAKEAVEAIPHKIAKDLRYLAPVEFPATMMAAFPLVAIRSGFRFSGNPEGMTAADISKGKDSRIKDVIGCIPAYAAFFEFGERMFDDFQTRRGYPKNEHSHSHVKGILPPEEQAKEKKPYDAMLEDTPARMYFYKVASVAAGIVPYIAWSRYAQNNLGWQMKTKTATQASDRFWKAWTKEQGMYQGFALYTVGSELVRNNIDKMFKRLQDKELEKQQGINK